MHGENEKKRGGRGKNRKMSLTLDRSDSLVSIISWWNIWNAPCGSRKIVFRVTFRTPDAPGAPEVRRNATQFFEQPPSNWKKLSRKSWITQIIGTREILQVKNHLKTFTAAVVLIKHQFSRCNSCCHWVCFRLIKFSINYREIQLIT